MSLFLQWMENKEFKNFTAGKGGPTWWQQCHLRPRSLQFIVGKKRLYPNRWLRQNPCYLPNSVQCQSYLCINCTLWLLGSPNTWSSQCKRIASLFPVGYLTIVEIVARKSIYRQSQRPHNRPHHVYCLHGRIHHERFGLLSPFPWSCLIHSPSLLEYTTIHIQLYLVIRC